MSKYAPGPWSLGEPEGVGTGLFVSVHSPAHGELATVVWCLEDDNFDDAPSPSCQANAHLIIAAPDLYKAVLRLLSSSTPANTAQRKCWKELSAAIDKADGKA